MRATIVPVPDQRLLIPAYFYPAGPGAEEWDRMIAAAPTVGAIILNPGLYSEPDFDAVATDPVWVETIQRAQAEGIAIIAYVPIGYGTGDHARIKAQIDWFYDRYAVDGIFFDEVADVECGWYAPLTDYARAQIPGGLIVGNDPNRDKTPECHMAHFDILNIFESDLTFYVNGYLSPDWRADYDYSRFCDIVTVGETIEQVLTGVESSQSRDLPSGWLYISMDLEGSAYDSLPAEDDWAAYLDAVSSWSWGG